MIKSREQTIYDTLEEKIKDAFVAHPAHRPLIRIGGPARCYKILEMLKQHDVIKKCVEPDAFINGYRGFTFIWRNHKFISSYIAINKANCISVKNNQCNPRDIFDLNWLENNFFNTLLAEYTFEDYIINKMFSKP